MTSPVNKEIIDTRKSSTRLFLSDFGHFKYFSAASLNRGLFDCGEDCQHAEGDAFFQLDICLAFAAFFCYPVADFDPGISNFNDAMNGRHPCKRFIHHLVARRSLKVEGFQEPLESAGG